MSYIVEPNLTKRSGNTNQDVIVSSRQETFTSPNGTTTYGTPFDVRQKMFQTYWYGWNTPDFYKRKRSGELLAFTPWKKYSFTGEINNDYFGSYWYNPNDHNAGYYQYSYSAGLAEHDTHQMVTMADLDETAPTSYDQYVGEAAAKIYGAGYDALTALGEVKETIGMFANLAKRFNDLRFPSNILKRLRKRDKTLLVKDLLSEWVGIRYGWRVFFYDLIGLNEVLSKFDESRTRYSEKCGTKSSTTYSEPVTDSLSHFRYDIVKTKKVEQGIRGAVVADIMPPKFKFNLLDSAWEMLPLSFVVDWFLNVGKTLSSFSFLVFASDYAACAGFQTKMTKTWESFDSYGFDSYVKEAWAHYDSTCVGVLKVRTPCRVPLTPSVVVRLNTLKIADLIGLASQRLR